MQQSEPREQLPSTAQQTPLTHRSLGGWYRPLTLQQSASDEQPPVASEQAHTPFWQKSLRHSEFVEQFAPEAILQLPLLQAVPLQQSASDAQAPPAALHAQTWLVHPP